MQSQNPNITSSLTSGTWYNGSFIEVFNSVDPTVTDINYVVQQRWFNTTTNVEWILIGFSTSGSVIQANWQPISTGPSSDIVQYNVLTGGPDHTINSVPPSSSGTVLTSNGSSAYPSFQSIPVTAVTDHYSLVGGPGNTITSVNPSTAGFVLTSNGSSVDPSFQEVSLNSQSQYATFLVNPTPGEGTHTTIQAAVNAASFGDTIWIYSGTYTEDVSVTTAGIIISAYQSSVIIIGNLQYNASGVLQLNNIVLQTALSNALTISGSGSLVRMYGGGVLATDATGILISTTGGGLICRNGNFNTSSTGIALFNASSADATSLVAFINCYLENSGGSTFTSVYNCQGIFERSFIGFTIQATGTANSRYDYNYITTQSINRTGLILTSSGNYGIHFCSIISGTGSCIISSSGMGEVSGCFLASFNALAINAPSSLVAYGNTYANNGSTINCVQSAGALGLLGVAPSNFAIGQLIQQTTSSGSPVSLTTNTSANVTSALALTPGTWTISGIIGFVTNAATSVTQIQLSLSTTSATLGTNYGLDTIANKFSAQLGIQQTLTLPSLVVTVTTSTNYYLVTQATFTLNTMSAYGTITAQRTG